MKTNISGLMSLIKENEAKIGSLEEQIILHAENKSTLELNGVTNIIEDNKDDFLNDLSEYEKLINYTTYLKGVLYQKNNEFKLSDGRNIQEALVDINNLKKLKNVYDMLLLKRNTKVRFTEVNNSYFAISEVNFNVEEIKQKKSDTEKSIYNTEFEISKLNSIEFEIKK